jgi:hypothetical protein
MFKLDEENKQTENGHPEEETGVGFKRMSWGFLAAKPQLGRGGWSYVHSRAAVHGGFSVEGKKEDERTDEHRQSAPKCLFLHDSKTHVAGSLA